MCLFEYIVPAASESFSTSAIDYFDKEIREESEVLQSRQALGQTLLQIRAFSGLITKATRRLRDHQKQTKRITGMSCLGRMGKIV